MSLVSANKTETNTYAVEISISAEDFAAAVQQAYLKQRKSITLPGFRKGKAPRQMIEKLYGKEVFYEDALEIVFPTAVEAAYAEAGITPVDQPKDVDVKTMNVEEGVVLAFNVTVKPEITLKAYKGITAEKEEAKVTAEDVEHEIGHMLERGARMVDVDDRAVADGDIAVIDFEGFVDGVAFDGGKAEKYNLTIGSGSFIPGFEDQLVGASAGDTVDVKVTFPTEYHAKDLAGKAAVFKCKVNAVKVNELPELNDDFAQDVSECDTLEAYKAQIAEDLKARKSADLNKKRTAAIFDKIIEKLECEIPAPITETRAEMMIEDMARNLQYQGLSIEQYMQYMGTDINGLKESIRPQALRAVQEELILSEIAKAEKLEVSEEDIEKEIADMAKMYSMEADKLKSLISEQEMAGMKEDLLKKKAEEFLAEAVKA